MSQSRRHTIPGLAEHTGRCPRDIRSCLVDLGRLGWTRLVLVDEKNRHHFELTASGLCTVYREAFKAPRLFPTLSGGSVRHEAIAIELDMVVQLWVDLDPGSAPTISGPAEAADPKEEPEASVVAGMLRGLELSPALLEAIAEAYELEILQETTAALQLREHPSLPLPPS